MNSPDTINSCLIMHLQSLYWCQLLDCSTGQMIKMIVLIKKQFLLWPVTFIKADIDRFYMPKKHDGWSIKEIITAYECRIVSVKQDFTQNKKNNKYLNKVIESERNGIIRITNDFLIDVC